MQTSNCSDESWAGLAKEDDWKVVMQLMVSALGEDFEVSCLSACSLAFLGNIYKDLWSDYSALGHMQTFGVVSLFGAAVKSIGK